jgi:hypothetical protein
VDLAPTSAGCLGVEAVFPQATTKSSPIALAAPTRCPCRLSVDDGDENMATSLELLGARARGDEAPRVAARWFVWVPDLSSVRGRVRPAKSWAAAR